ncbi:hypothetical protein H4219_000057 [Mycoemilia scoparia]|uniref:Uncharacterized protein n=1 Tax=Mycoemilia scoparia TaxID=417184 RepID=A0A9W8DXB3_9FUNG|nr:hypothetical protein H4219_000057 [Mycoemilia scoparia]
MIKGFSYNIPRAHILSFHRNKTLPVIAVAVLVLLATTYVVGASLSPNHVDADLGSGVLLSPMRKISNAKRDLVKKLRTRGPKSSSSSSSKRLCNGYEELCSRNYTDVTFPATHNSFAYRIDNIAANQELPITEQLDDGVRAFMLDLHQKNRNTIPPGINVRRKRSGQPKPPSSSNSTTEISLCHTMCLLLYDGPLVDELAHFKRYLDDNTQEVITIFFENVDSFAPKEIASNFEAVGLDKYAFAPNITDGSIDWPTLGDMVNDNKRLVVFSDRSANTKEVPWLLPQGDFVAQTSFEVLNGTTFPCSPDHPNKPLVILNHFAYTQKTLLGNVLPIPIYDGVQNINSAQSFRDQLNMCNDTLKDKAPNFVAVDFYNKGDLFDVVAQVNKLPSRSLKTNTFSKGKSSASPLPPNTFSYASMLVLTLNFAYAMACLL